MKGIPILFAMATVAEALLLSGCGKVFGDAILAPDRDTAARDTVTATSPATDTTTAPPSQSDTETSHLDAGNEETDAENAFILGVDISYAQEQEDLGIAFIVNDEEKDIIEIFADHGFNFIRLRLFHDPGQPNGYQFDEADRAQPYCDLTHTLAMAKRAKARGMGLFLVLHYSDTWADQEQQSKPTAWADLDFDALAAAVRDYTTQTLLAFDEAGVMPEMVQIGNATTPGMLLPDGAAFENWDGLAALLEQGTSAVKAVSPDIKTVLHLERCSDPDTAVAWFDAVLARGVEVDVIGQTCYPIWHGPPDTWEATFNRLAEHYPDLHFILAEYSYKKRAANELIFNLPNERGLGTFLWEPTVEMEQLFDFEDDTAVANDLFEIYDRLSAELVR